MDNAGGLASAPGVPGYDATDKYIDWWVEYPSGGSNDFTYSEHWMVTPDDPGVHVYLVADHAATDPTGSIGQVQWVFRLDLSKFNYLYLANEDLSNPGPVKLGPMPTYAEYFGTVNPDGLGATDSARLERLQLRHRGLNRRLRHCSAQRHRAKSKTSSSAA